MFAATLFVLTLVPSPPQAKDYSADTKSPQTVVAALYDVISGPAGQKRDWDRFRNLFSKTARLVPSLKRGDKMVRLEWNPDDYVKSSGEYLEKYGFFEKELGRKTTVYGPVAQVQTAYESRSKLDGKDWSERGINFVQLTFDGDRWYVESLTWTDETTGGKIPATLLGSKD